MSEIVLGSTADISNYRFRSNSAPSWLTEPGYYDYQQDVEEEEYIEESPDHDEKSNNNSTNDTDQPQEITFINIISYLIVCFTIISCIYSLGLIINEINMNPNFNSFLAAFIFTITFGALTFISVFIYDISDEISVFLKEFTMENVIISHIKND